MCSVQCNVSEDKDRASRDMDEYAKGVQVFHQAKNLDALMEFLARYVRKVHADKFLKRKLIEEPGSTFLDLISASDIAYVICLVKNSGGVWSQSLRQDDTEDNNDEDKVKPLFTAGQGKKRVYGETVWSQAGQDYYDKALKNWRHAYDTKNAHYGVLRTAWEAWVKDKGNTVMLSNSTRKTVKSVLRTREESEVAQLPAVGNQQGTNDIAGDNAGARMRIVQYESDRDDHPRFGGSPWCARGATRARQVVQDKGDEDKESDSESEDSESEDSEDEGSVESEDSNPLDRELAAAADPPVSKNCRKRKAAPSTGTVSQSTRNSRKKNAGK